MKPATLALISLLLGAGTALGDHHSTAEDAIANPKRAADNVARDPERKPAQVLEFIDLAPGATVLDWGAGGGYWTELFAGEVGTDGKVVAQQRAGERYDSMKDKILAQFAPFGNIQSLPMETGVKIPLEDNSVDLIMLSYIYHHMHYADDSGESLPKATSDVLAEFRRVLKPGGEFVVIEHVAAPGSSRAQSASWHRTPPATAKADITGAGFEFVADAPDIYVNPDDDLKNAWGETGLRGHTTGFVQKYRSPD